MDVQDALILVVDDNEMNRDMLSRRLERQGQRSMVAEDGVHALELLRAHNFDLILLDIMMPRLNGYQVLEQVKADAALRHIPVIMISAVDDLDSVVKCIELGAEDYLFKPFNPILLKARIHASLEKKRLLDQERRFHQPQISHLLSPELAERGQRGEIAAETFPEAAVLMVRLALAAGVPPVAAAQTLNHLLVLIDDLAQQRGLYGVKTFGAAYIAVGGAPMPQANYAEAILALALDIHESLTTSPEIIWRIGLTLGPVSGGFRSDPLVYDLWGDCIDDAKRLCLAAPVGEIRVTAAAAEALPGYHFELAGTVDAQPVYRLVKT
ncbi:MAG TPA: response regulator [Phototrophicaceae bacterium]|nr:response regulator [Phototrophicaceae bacterium]